MRAADGGAASGPITPSELCTVGRPAGPSVEAGAAAVEADGARAATAKLVSRTATGRRARARRARPVDVAPRGPVICPTLGREPGQRARFSANVSNRE